MDILKIVCGYALKAALSAAGVLAYITALVWGVENFFDSGGWDWNGSDAVDYMILFVSVTAAGLWGFSKLFEAINMKLIARFFSKTFKWFLIGGVVCFFVFFSIVMFQEIRNVTSVFMVVVVAVGALIGAYLAYIAAGLIVGFVGWSFEILGNDLPGGRAVLLSEMINSGYSKPQNQVFIAELAQQRGGMLNVYTTAILYGIPLCTFIGMFASMFF